MRCPESQTNLERSNYLPLATLSPNFLSLSQPLHSNLDFQTVTLASKAYLLGRLAHLDLVNSKDLQHHFKFSLAEPAPALKAP